MNPTEDVWFANTGNQRRNAQGNAHLEVHQSTNIPITFVLSLSIFNFFITLKRGLDMVFSNLDEVLEFINIKRKIKRKSKGKPQSKPKKRIHLWKKMQPEIVSLYNKGYNVNQISRMLKVSYDTVANSLKYAGIKVERRGKKHKVFRETLELLCEYVINPSDREVRVKYGRVYSTRIQEFFRYTDFPRPRYLNELERREIAKAIKEFLNNTDKLIFTIDDLKPLIEKAKPYKKMWKGKLRELAPAIWKLYNQGYKIKEIAKMLNITERSVMAVVYKKRYLHK